MKRRIVMIVLAVCGAALALGSWSWSNYPLGYADSGETRLAGMIGLSVASILVVTLVYMIVAPLLRKGMRNK